jgi:uncharacterized protein (TIGR02453 family)
MIKVKWKSYMDTKIIMKFLKDLESNNTFDWMKINNEYYKQAKNEFEFFLLEIINGIYSFDNTIKMCPPKELIFKLNRDTRFSNDKSPYNPSFRAHVSKNGKLPIPVGYYISIRPGSIFLGGGLFVSISNEATKSIRDYIEKYSNKFIEIIEEDTFKSNFTIYGEKLKKVPNGYDSEHKLAEYLKNKSWYIEYKIMDSIFLKPEEFIKEAIIMFKYMKPFNDFMNKALIGFKMPVR